MWFRMCRNFKTAPNVGEVSFVSVFSPIFEWIAKRGLWEKYVIDQVKLFSMCVVCQNRQISA